MSKKEAAVEVLAEVLKLIEKIGCEKTLKILKEEGDAEYHSFDKRVKEYILKIACKIFEISKDELLYGTSHNKRTDALSVCFFLYSKLMKYSQPQIANDFNKDVSLINKYIHRINNLMPSFKDDRILLDKLNHITKESEIFIENLRKEIFGNNNREKKVKKSTIAK